MGKWCEVKCNCSTSRPDLAGAKQEPVSCEHQGIYLQFWPGGLLAAGSALTDIFGEKTGFTIFQKIADWRNYDDEYLCLSPAEVQLWESAPDHKTVIVRHHAPCLRSVPAEYTNSLVSAAYASNMDEVVINSGASLWVHGHVHASLDYRVGVTRIVCNARGYPDEPVKGFDPGLTVAI